MQALLAEYAWGWKAALAALQRFIVAQLGDPEAIVVLDETAELKKGPPRPARPGNMPGSPGRWRTARAICSGSAFSATTRWPCLPGSGGSRLSRAR
jgi:hypothetical protein